VAGRTGGQAGSAGAGGCGGGGCGGLTAIGHSCLTAADCASNHCADGVCCNSDCTGSCQSCGEFTSPGMCVTVTGPPRPGHAGCAGSGGACAGVCDGQHEACQYPMASTPCGAAKCENATMTPVGACDGAGTCTQTAVACPTAYCASGTACGPCANDTQCGAGKWCDLGTNGGTCLAKKPNGTACATATPNQCASGTCVADVPGNGVCCATTCSGNTPRCNAAGTACVCSGSSCSGSMVCTPGGTCCTPNACYFDSACRTSDCDPGCGMAVRARNCGCTFTVCCGDSCCVSGSCVNGSCTQPTMCI